MSDANVDRIKRDAKDAANKSKEVSRALSNSLIDFSHGSTTQAGVTVTGFFLGCIPLSAGLARTSFIQSFLTSTFRFGLNCFGGIAGAPTLIQGGSQEAMKLLIFASAFNAFMTYAVTPGLSIAGQVTCVPYQNKEPRTALKHLYGKGQRMYATHQNMMETFPIFALTAGIIDSCAPPTSTSDVLLTYVLMHVFFKTAVYIPAYVFDIDVARTTSHALSIGACVSALWNIMTRV
ncbi:hypothetical protein FRB96_007376 [Tulasnella sp. 330]|nr:hypothetical protein FRB96_007376 [Tulasnella sp. 330]